MMFCIHIFGFFFQKIVSPVILAKITSEISYELIFHLLTFVSHVLYFQSLIWLKLKIFTGAITLRMHFLLQFVIKYTHF